jgi:polyisoprenoid-binding protein YceI
MVDSTRRLRFVLSVTIPFSLTMLLVACVGSAPAAPALPTDAAIGLSTPAAGGAEQAAQPTATIQELSTPLPASGAGTSLVLADSGNEAKYMVREQLADLSFPSDAIGTTSDVSGAIVVSPDGTFVPKESSITVNLSSIRSDQDRRDNYVRQRVLETSRYPSAVFVPIETRGLDVSALGSGGTAFELVGDLTLHGVTKQVVWDVTATLAGDTLTGTATTEFTFEDFGMTVPSVMVVLSVDDNIRLQYDFTFVIESG